MRYVLRTATTDYGPFRSITSDVDNWYCDGTVWPKGVLGSATIQNYTEPTPSTPPEPVPATISRLQLILGMTQAGLITSAEGEAAASGAAIPAVVDQVFAGLPAAQAVGARIRFNAMTVVERANPLIAAVAAASNKTSAQMDQYFRDWSAL